MVHLVIRWETSQMSNELEWRYWRQIRGAFFPVPADVEFHFVPQSESLTNITAAQHDTMGEALAALPAGMPRVFLEPTGPKGLSEIPAGDVAIICGCTETGNVQYAEPGELYSIATPGSTVLYAHDAVSIALGVRHGQ